jgi:hypothetical protein
MSATNFSATIARNSSPKVWSPVDHKEGEGALPVPWRRGRGADLVSLESNQVEEAGLKQRGPAMRFDHFSCGSVRIDRNTHKHDVIIRSPRNPQAKRTVQEISRVVQPHAAFEERGNPLAMPPTRPRQRCTYGPIARHARGTARGRASEN